VGGAFVAAGQRGYGCSIDHPHSRSTQWATSPLVLPAQE